MTRTCSKLIRGLRGSNLLLAIVQFTSKKKHAWTFMYTRQQMSLNPVSSNEALHMVGIIMLLQVTLQINSPSSIPHTRSL